MKNISFTGVALIDCLDREDWKEVRQTLAPRLKAASVHWNYISAPQNNRFLLATGEDAFVLDKYCEELKEAYGESPSREQQIDFYRKNLCKLGEKFRNLNPIRANKFERLIRRRNFDLETLTIVKRKNPIKAFFKRLRCFLKAERF
ncbi:MAG: hypothetical protein PHC64_01285 [Candidatus Gastranaerophilales bacterium]|nr:hypothetical protein [Candidatus Gastranaerophilales bacterium]